MARNTQESNSLYSPGSGVSATTGTGAIDPLPPSIKGTQALGVQSVRDVKRPLPKVVAWLKEKMDSSCQRYKALNMTSQRRAPVETDDLLSHSIWLQAMSPSGLHVCGLITFPVTKKTVNDLVQTHEALCLAANSMADCGIESASSLSATVRIASSYRWDSQPKAPHSSVLLQMILSPVKGAQMFLVLDRVRHPLRIVGEINPPANLNLFVSVAAQPLMDLSPFNTQALIGFPSDGKLSEGQSSEQTSLPVSKNLQPAKTLSEEGGLSNGRDCSVPVALRQESDRFPQSAQSFLGGFPNGKETGDEMDDFIRSVF